MTKINLYNKDCIEFMKGLPDNYYSLACVDPPYGSNDAINVKNCKNENKQASSITNYKTFTNIEPPLEY
jgi:DNA modification methylase